MPFVTNQAKVPTTSAGDVGCAEKLHEAVRTRCVAAGRRWSRDSWAKEFTLLRQIVPEDQIAKVLDIYCANIKNKWAPEAWCGKSFRLKYDKIHAFAGRVMSSQYLTTIKVTPDVAKAAKRLESLGWPKGVEDQVAPVLQASTDFLADLRLSLAKSKRPFARRVLSNIGDPVSYAESYLNDLNGRLKNKPSWSGRLDYMIINTDVMTRTGRGWAAEYGDKGGWDELMKEVGIAS